jgi:hypothetical protein
MVTATFLVRLALVGLALLALAEGSSSVLVTLLVVTPKAHPEGYTVGANAVLRYLWPLSLFGAGVLDAAALLTARRTSGAILLLLVVVVAYVLVRYALRLIFFVARHTRTTVPLRGLSAVLVVLLFVALNAAAVYFAVWYILQDRALTITF